MINDLIRRHLKRLGLFVDHFCSLPQVYLFCVFDQNNLVLYSLRPKMRPWRPIFKFFKFGYGITLKNGPKVVRFLAKKSSICRGSPTYTKITNTVFGLCMCKWGIFAIGTIHLRCRQIFTIFDPFPPTIGIPGKCL